MTVKPKGTLPIPPRAKLRRNLFVLILLGLGVYLFLSEVARIEHAFQVVSTLKIPLVALSMGAQVLSYLASGYLLRAVVKLAAKPISVVDGALLTPGRARWRHTWKPGSCQVNNGLRALCWFRESS